MKNTFYTLFILAAFFTGINSVSGEPRKASAATVKANDNLFKQIWANYIENKFAPAPKKEQTNQADLKEKVKGYLASQPVKFLENKGQMMDVNNKPVPFVLFKAEAPGMNVYITEKGLTYVFVKAEEEEHEREREKEKKHEKGMLTGPEEENIKMEMAWVNVNLEGANIQRSNIVKEGQSTEHFNYFYGHCPEGIYDVSQYDKITIKEVYPGIDWVLYNSQKGGMKYDFVVHPGADASQIKMLYEGENALKLKEDGSVDMQTQLGMFSEAKPYSYQEGSANEIKSAYKLTPINKNKTRLEFNLAQHNPNNTLIIDPQLVWGTFFGSSNPDYASDLAIDAAGNVFATGRTDGTNFPILNASTYFQASFAGGGGDAFILKFNNSGVLLWSTYYGGNSNEAGTSITCDITGNVFVTGFTWSTNFPVFNPMGGAYFQGTNLANGIWGTVITILKFSNTGVRLWATYYGGSTSALHGPGNGRTICYRITCDNSGNVFVTGNTDNTNFPVFNPMGGAYFQGTFAGGNCDAFILKFSNSGVQLWATLYGGNGFNSLGYDAGYSIACDNWGNVFVAGLTASNTFPVLNSGTFYQGTGAGANDGFILKFNNSGVRLWATYYGGSTNDWLGDAIACDNSGNVFITGMTLSANFPVLNPGGGAYFQIANAGSYDAVILKFDNAGNCLWATYYGGSGFEGGGGGTLWPCSIVFDACQNVYISTITSSTNMPTQSYQAGCGGFNVNTSGAGSAKNAFLLKFTNTGQRLWGTYIGNNANSYWACAIVCDVNNNIFLSGFVNSNSSPIANPGGGAYYDPTLNGTQDAFFMKFIPIPPTYTKTQTNATACTCNGVATISVTCGDAPYTYQWSNAVTVSNTTLTTHSISGLCPGVYQVTVTSCPNYSYTTSYTLTGAASNLTVNATVQNANCTSPTGSVIINSVTNGVPNYTLAEASTTLAVGFNTPYTLSNVSVGTHTYVLTSSNGCNTTFTAQILPGGSQPNITATGPVTLNCVPNTTNIIASTTSTAALTYTWSGPGVLSGANTLTATVNQAGIYTITAALGSCTNTATVSVISNTVTPNISITNQPTLTCLTTSAVLQGNSTTGGATYSWSPLNVNTATATVNTAGNYTLTVTNPTNGCTSTSIVAVLQNTTTPVITSAIASNSLTCVNTNATLTATSAGNTIVWNGGSLTNAVNPALVTAAGNYTATATNPINGCTSTSIVAVLQNTTAPVIPSAIASNSLSCANTNATLTATSAGNTIVWNGGSLSNAANPAVINAGFNYTVTATSASNGCFSSSVISVPQNTLQPTISVSSSGNINCNTTSVTLTSNSTSSGLSYSWSPNVFGPANLPTATITAAGIYSLSVSNPVNGCSNTAIVSVTASPMFTANISVLSQINCFGANNGALQVNVNGGSMPFTITNLNNNNTLTNINTFPLTLNNLSAGNYSIQVSDASGCQQVLYSSISQPSPLNVLVTGNSSLCAGSSASLSSNVSGGTAPYNFMWSPNGGTAPNTVVSPNVSTTYTLTVTDNNGCQAATNIAIAVNPSPGANVINNQLVGCAPVCASFSLAQNQNGNYNYNWVFTSSAPSPTVINFNQYNPQLCFTKEGVYTANVSITTAQGCTTTITYTNLVTVYPKPIADFYYSPTNPTILEPKVSFTNTTVGASQFSWYNVNDLFSQQTNPSFTFQDPGKFLVTLIAGDGNCSDTISKYVVIEDDFSFYIPNAFTPDENNLNDYFYPVMRGYTDKNYVFMIFDRWGELIFKTNDTESKGWDGYYKNQLCKDDAYTWRVYVTDKRSKGHEFTGHVVLMK